MFQLQAKTKFAALTNSISATFTFARLLGQILVRTGFYKILLPRSWRLPLWVVLVFPMKKLDINLEFSCSPLTHLSELLPNLFKWIQLLFSLSFICCFRSILFLELIDIHHILTYFTKYENIQNVFLADFKFSDIRPGKLDEKLYYIYPQKILRISWQLQRTISEKIGLTDANKDILRIDFPTWTLKQMLVLIFMMHQCNGTPSTAITSWQTIRHPSTGSHVSHIVPYCVQ